MSTAERAIRREAARRAGQPFISVDGDDAEPYSISRALLGDDAGFEAEVSQELRRTQPEAPAYKDHGGVMIPPHIFAATLEAGAANAGQELVFTVPGAFGRTLRPRPVAASLGCRIVPGASNLRLVRSTAGHTVRWLSTETLDAPDPENTQDMSFGAESPTPSIGMVDTAFSRHLNIQAPQLGQIIDDDFRAAVATVVDSALIAGSGANGQPEGLLVRGLPGIDLGGVAPTWDDLVDAEAMLSDAHADEQLAWLTSGRGRAALRSCPVLADAAAGPAWSRGQVLDWPAFASNVVPDLSAEPTPVPSGTIILGAWRNAVIGLHSIEVLIDQYSALKQGMIEASIFAVVSIGLVHPAFVPLTDGLFPQAS
jgi:HK97 family phage major capsid protein